MGDNKITVSVEQQFGEVIDIILRHKSRLTAWHVGGYVSTKLKSEEWGSKVVTQLSEYIRSQRPDIKGFGRSSIYNMVLFYDEYSSAAFAATVEKYLNSEFVQPRIGQIEASDFEPSSDHAITVQPKTAQIIQPEIGQMPKILELTTLTNHIEILCRCKNNEERMFYILYANKEHLVKRELQRCISNQTKHSESRLRNGLLEHMKQFILELGKDFIFMDQEYRLKIGASTFKADLLFFHRGLQALVAVELKKTKFHPRDLGQLEFYLEALDRDVKRSNENPSIGIILCPETDRVVVEYAMSRSMSPTMIAEYKRILIPQERMQEKLNEFCNLFLNKD